MYTDPLMSQGKLNKIKNKKMYNHAVKKTREKVYD